LSVGNRNVKPISGTAPIVHAADVDSYRSMTGLHACRKPYVSSISESGNPAFLMDFIHW
jgi:hypothetical protein